MNFTKEQQKAIDIRERNLLVAAAAGSGKTAVLVNRILKIVTEGEHPADIDRLLVMTFTKAAAAQMRERIETALQEKLDGDPFNEHLQKQMILIHTADITTIDSFCMSVLRNHFSEIDLDPAFRVADEGELKLMRQDILEKVLEEAYQEKTESFLSFIESFSAKKNDVNVIEAVEQLYQYSQSKPFPGFWLDSCDGNYQFDSEEELLSKPFMQEIFVRMQENMQEILRYAKQNLSLCLAEGGPYMYEKAVRSDLASIEYLARCKNIQELGRGFATLTYETLSRKSDPQVDIRKKEEVKSIRASIKKMLETVKNRYFYTDLSQMAADMAACRRNAEELVRLTRRFSQEFTQAKRKKNIVDFGDLEHLALEILLEELPDGGYGPSHTALEYRDFYEEILVDEYQDSNMVQEYLLNAVSKEENGRRNLFMVGDVKQSIYKFRLACPEIFMEKYDAYETHEEAEGDLRIDLHQNFRSRREVIDTVNFIFSQLMQKEVGGITYDEAAALVTGADFREPACGEKPYESELLLIGEDEEKEIGSKELEARAVAKRIKELVGAFPVGARGQEEQRMAEYSDIVILLRSNAGWDEIFKKVLQEEGIPVSVTSKTGYFSSLEIVTLLDFLTLLDNPRNDCVLAAVMKSLFGGFSDEELARIRCHTPEGSFFEAVEADETEKTAAFRNRIAEYRAILSYTPIHELLQKIIRDFRYDYFISAMPRGAMRVANVNILLKKAADFEKTSYKGLFHFARYIEQLKKYEVDYGEANLLGENENCVRIMSIHKSKGLEFPICFLCGMSKRFNRMDFHKALIPDADEGIAMNYVNPKLRVRESTILKNAIIEKQMYESMGEELRVLYVAMTRAEEKLIMTGTVPFRTFEKKIGELAAECRIQEGVSLQSGTILRAGTFLDLILLALLRNQAADGLCEYADLVPNQEDGLYRACVPVSIQVTDLMQMTEIELTEQVRHHMAKQELLSVEEDRVYSEETEASLLKHFSYVYPYEQSGAVYTKVSVSDLKLKHMKEEDEEVFALVTEEEEILPRFMRKEQKGGIGGAARGTIYHKVMELCDFTISAGSDRIEDMLQKMITDGFLTAEELAVVRRSDIAAFFRTSLAGRMGTAQRAGRLFKEQPFVLGRPASEVDPEFSGEETILIQGIIDVWFEEEDGLVVADYKTDRVDTKEDLGLRYQVQLDYYAKALEQLTGKRVKEKILYSFALGCEISL